MALFKKFYGKNVSVRFFPDAGENNEPIIHIEPKKGMNRHDLRAVKEKMETILSVQDSGFKKFGGKPVFTVTLDKSSNSSNVEELLRTMFHGGSTENDAFGIENEKPELPEVPQPQASTPQTSQPDPNMTIQPEAFTSNSIYSLFLESTYRTGEYWEILARSAGRSKHSIDENTLFSMRRQFSRKPKGKKRDEVLRSLDKAMRYFARKYRTEQGPEAAEEFKNKYRSIGDLVPSDYSAKSSHLDSTDASSEESSTESPTQSAMNIADLFGGEEEHEEEDFYDSFETKE